MLTINQMLTNDNRNEPFVMLCYKIRYNTIRTIIKITKKNKFKAVND